MSLRGACPIVPVSDMAATAAFYTKTLGFDAVIDNAEHGYACFKRDETLIAIVKAAGEEPLRATRNNISAQIWVDSVDALWDEWKDRLLALPDWKPDDGPFSQPYGTRELHVKCPDGFLMQFTSVPTA